MERGSFGRFSEEQDGAPDMVQNVIDHGAKENVSDLSGTPPTKDEKLELIAIRDPADEGAGGAEFQPRFRFHPCFGEKLSVMSEQLFAGPACRLPDHLHLKVGNHPVGEPVDIGDVKKDQDGGKPILSGDDGLNCLCRGFGVIDGDENFRLHASSPGQKDSGSVAVDQPRQGQHQIGPVSQQQQNGELNEQERQDRLGDVEQVAVDHGP